jgi:nicotinamide-nucleotide amidase
MAVAGGATSVITLETGSNERAGNMQVFAATALKLLLKELE